MSNLRDKELEEILDKVAVEAVAIMLAGKAELYIPTVKKYEQKLLAWRDKAVKEARIDELKYWCAIDDVDSGLTFADGEPCVLLTTLENRIEELQ